MSIAVCLESVRLKINEAEKKRGRMPGQIQLLAVSKSQPVAAIRAAFEAGQRQFGENYLQEALPKMKALQAHSIEWHFIGAIQSNKIKKIAAFFDWVQSVDSLEIAKRLSAERPASLPPLHICIQVNQDKEPTKRGVMPHQLSGLVREVLKLPRLCLRGMMAIPEPVSDFEAERKQFCKLRLLWESVREIYPWDVLSMGISNDFEAAIAEGSTMVRLGTAIFGERRNRVS